MYLLGEQLGEYGDDVGECAACVVSRGVGGRLSLFGRLGSLHGEFRLGLRDRAPELDPLHGHVRRIALHRFQRYLYPSNISSSQE